MIFIYIFLIFQKFQWCLIILALKTSPALILLLKRLYVHDVVCYRMNREYPLAVVWWSHLYLSDIIFIPEWKKMFVLFRKCVNFLNISYPYNLLCMSANTWNFHLKICACFSIPAPVCKSYLLSANIRVRFVIWCTRLRLLKFFIILRENSFLSEKIFNLTSKAMRERRKKVARRRLWVGKEKTS